MKHSCVICFLELPRAQRTCGSAECLDAWKNIRSQTARQKRANLATYTPSERALITAQSPEPSPDPDFIDRLREQAESEKVDLTPSFLRFDRDKLDPNNAPIKKEDNDDVS